MKKISAKIALVLITTFIPTVALSYPYVVQPGDTLKTIAEQHSTEWKFITGYDDPDLIYPGQELEIPEPVLGNGPILGDLRVTTAPQGGTGIGSATAGDVGDCLKVLDDSPFAYELAGCTSGFVTTTINGASGPAFTFATSTGIGIASSAGTITFSNTGVLSANGITGAVNWLAGGPGLTVASSGQNITYTYSSSSLNLGNLSLIDSPLPVANGGTATTTAPTDSQVLSASSTSPKWKTLGVSGLLTFTTSTSNLTIGFVSSSLSLGNLSVINSPLPVANGGTATGTAPFDLSILTGQGGAYAQKTLTAGTNITISTTSGAITFAATGGSGNVNATGTVNYFPYFTATTTLSATSSVYASGTRIGIGTISPSTTLHVIGGITATASSTLTSTTLNHATMTTATVSGNFNASGTSVHTATATFQGAISQTGSPNSFTSSTFNGHATATTLGVTATSSFGGNAVPTTNDGAALGNTALKWSDLFLASTSVINFSSGDLTITHATDTLTFGGGTFDFGSSTALVLPRGVGGTTVDATGEATVDSTARTLNFYDGTAEVVLNPEQCSAPVFTIQNQTTSSTADVLQQFKVTSTITQVNVSGKALGNTITGNFYASTSRQAATSTSRKVFAADTAFSATTTASSSCYASATSTPCVGGAFGANASTTINANSYFMFYANSASTTQTEISWCWRENP